jgi:hypothetical protein
MDGRDGFPVPPFPLQHLLPIGSALLSSRFFAGEIAQHARTMTVSRSGVGPLVIVVTEWYFSLRCTFNGAELMKKQAKFWRDAVAFGIATAISAAPVLAATATPGVLAAFIAAGPVDPNGKVPAINAVAGAGVSNRSEAFPVAVLQHGSAYTFLLASQNTTYAGTCKDSFTLTQGSGASKVTLAHGVIKGSYSCAAGTTWAWDINSAAIPDSPGLATLTGIVTYGASRAITKTTVLIQ